MSHNLATNRFFCRNCANNMPKYNPDETQKRAKKDCGCGRKKRKI